MLTLHLSHSSMVRVQNLRLEAPFVFQPDTGFLSFDGIEKEPESWLEMPLKSDRVMPFRCAVRRLLSTQMINLETDGSV